MAPVWIEVALNGGRGPARQPRIPLSVDQIVAEGVACAQAGAAIVHFHVYDATTGRQHERDVDLHRRVLDGIRSRCDALAYPTTAMQVLGQPLLGDERFAVERALIEEGLLEWFVLDPGSVTMAHVSDLPGGYVYLNQVNEIIEAYGLARDHSLHPALALYELGFARTARETARQVCHGSDPSVYRMMFSDRILYGLPPSAEALQVTADALRLLGVERWMLAGIDLNVEPLLDAALALDADLRVGLEDAPPGTDASNLELLAVALAAVERAGKTAATPTEVRRALAAEVGT